MSVGEIKTGQDSFLDIVANLVGILIILVVVVGASASQSLIDRTPVAADSSELVELENEIQRTALVAEKLEADNHRLEAQIEDEVEAGAALQQHRHRVLVRHEQTKQVLASLRASLSVEEIETLDRSAELALLESQLEDIERRRNALAVESVAREEVIDHYPAPIAKTVFSDEIHFRLHNGRVSYVPMDELVEIMKAELPVAAERLKDAPETTQTVGPLDGYRLQYTLVSDTVVQRSDFGMLEQQVARFDRFVMLPMNREVGEEIEVATAPGSAFRQVIDRREPEKTTISIWVYPESFEEFNLLKKWLREHGFQTAGWPLAEGRPISGGPNGFRTSAQ